MKTQQQKQAGARLIKVIRNATSKWQLDVAKNMVNVYYKMFGQNGLFDLLIAMKHDSLSKHS